MKQVIFSTLTALFFLGINAHAEGLTFQQAHEKIFTALEEQGYLDGLSTEERQNAQNMVFDEVASEFGNSASLNLSEDAQQAFLLDSIKKIGSKIISGAKTVISGASKLISSVAAKAKELYNKYAPKLIGFAKQMLPKLAGIASDIASKYNLDPQLVQGALGKLPEDEQQALDPAKAEAEVMEALDQPAPNDE